MTEELEAQRCPKCDKKMVLIRDRYLECPAGHKFDTWAAGCPEVSAIPTDDYGHTNNDLMQAADMVEKGLDPAGYKVSEGKPEEGAQRAISEFHLATLRDTEEILHYDKGVYRAGGESVVLEWLESSFDPCAGKFAQEVLGHVKRRTYADRENFDAEPFILNLANGLLNIDTLDFRPHSEDFLSFVQLPVSYEPLARCPTVEKFLSEVMYPEDIPVFQEWAGYVLWREYPAQKALLFEGGGNNGKSTAIGVLKSLLGVKNISSRSLQELEYNRFAKADLYGKLANLYADLSDSALKSVGTFKMLTGGDPTTAEYKFRNGFTFTNYAKLIFSANKVPEVFEDTDAFFRRWTIISFPNSFEGSRANTELSKSLTTTAELSGFLNWAIEGLKRLRSNGWRFSNSKSTEDTRLDYIRRSSPMKAFLMDCTFQDSKGSVGKQDLYKAFCEYCTMSKLPPVTQQTFFQNLPMYNQAINPARLGPGRVPSYLGLTLKSKADWGIKMENTPGVLGVPGATDSNHSTDSNPFSHSNASGENVTATTAGQVSGA
ncbi:MAG: phage/plasmid primase, P4 family [Nitrososphaerales archaeon]